VASAGCACWAADIHLVPYSDLPFFLILKLTTIACAVKKSSISLCSRLLNLTSTRFPY
jgi:hypothetical protein